MTPYLDSICRQRGVDRWGAGRDGNLGMVFFPPLLYVQRVRPQILRLTECSDRSRHPGRALDLERAEDIAPHQPSWVPCLVQVVWSRRMPRVAVQAACVWCPVQVGSLETKDAMDGCLNSTLHSGQNGQSLRAHGTMLSTLSRHWVPQSLQRGRCQKTLTEE